ncbi:MAG: YceK/YidQ family lipoprotein [Pseudomonas sp.]
MKLLIAVIATTLLSGCGTVNTTFRDDSVAKQDLRDYKTYCNAVPRIYSGVVYDFCSLHAPLPADNRPHQGSNAPLLLVDLALSGVVDTVVLPYTIYQQSTYGSINIYGR